MKYMDKICRLALSLWIGGAALFTLVLTPAIFGAYHRDTAGAIVGALFPGYFMWGLVMGAVALLSLLLSRREQKALPAAVLAVMLTVAALQCFVIEPRAAALKKEIPSFVTTPPDNPKRAEFRKLHGISSAVNLGVIAGGTALILLL